MMKDRQIPSTLTSYISNNYLFSFEMRKQFTDEGINKIEVMINYRTTKPHSS